MAISAVVIVYNEESRIESLLHCIKWCDEIIVLDKQSKDRTKEIAQKYTNLVFEIPYSDYDPSEIEYGFEKVTSEWVMLLTASDLIHPQLALQIKNLTDNKDFHYDVIHVPYRRYVLGLETKRSPWYSKLHPVVYRKKIIKINNQNIHEPFLIANARHFKMPDSTEYCFYHLTHATVDSMMERHLRYCRIDGRISSNNQPLYKELKPVISSIYNIIFKRKSYLMGWDGIALSFGWLSYWMLRFVYIWEKRRSKTLQTYHNLSQVILHAWDNTDGRKK